MKIPIDVKEMTEKYLIDKGGICGQSCLAVIEETTIKQVLKDWERLGLEFKGWSGWKQLKEYLEKKGYDIKLLRKDGWANFNKEDFVIARVQWIGNREDKEKPFYGWGHWTEASAHTHFIVIHNNEFFCNEDGIFNDLDAYLEDAVITSLMRIRDSSNTVKENCKEGKE